MRKIIGAAVLALSLAACGKGSEKPEEANAPAATPVDVQQEAQRVKAGMTEAQVVEILGKPRTRVKEATGDRLTFWTFDGQKQPKARVYVTLDKDGKVAEVETIPL